MHTRYSQLLTGKLSLDYEVNFMQLQDALCTDTPGSFVCTCKPGYVDYSPNPHVAPGLVCKKLINGKFSNF